MKMKWQHSTVHGQHVYQAILPLGIGHLLLDFSAGPKPGWIEHGQQGWIDVEVRPTIVTHRCCKPIRHMGITWQTYTSQGQLASHVIQSK